MYLNCHTGFSFQYGTLPVKALFEEAKRCGVHKLALTEINNTASWLEMARLCEEHRPGPNGLTARGDPGYQLDLAVGIEFRNGSHCQFIALARNNKGFAEINRFRAELNREERSVPDRAPHWQHVWVIYPWQRHEPGSLSANEYVGVQPHQLPAYALHAHRADYNGKFVLLHPVTLDPPEQRIDPSSGRQRSVHRDFNTHRLLRAIAQNTLLSKLPPQEVASLEEYMRPEAELYHRHADFPELLQQTAALLNSCSISITWGVDKNKKQYGSSPDSDVQFLRSETEKGYQERYGSDRSVWKSHIEKELAIIQRKGFVTYYLIAYDLIRFAQQRGFDFVGRGSGANSTVAYCLGITNVDPIELDLYFERFLNEERTSPPDFDIDFAWDQRDEVYQYLFERYGHEHVCLLGTHVTYQAKSILRELAKVFGLPREEADALVENPRALASRDHIAEKIVAYANYILQKELPAHLSIHAGGVLITEEPIYAYTATDTPPKGLPVSHFDMHGAEDVGIFKFDILSQRGLGHIREAVNQVAINRQKEVNVHRFRDFQQDEAVKALMRSGKTMGCFYVESPAMRMLLTKLRCEDYRTLVAASSIIRPGVASSGMMKAYIERFHAAREGRSYPTIHPELGTLLAETYGVMVYQEDVIKVAHHFAGLSLTQADVLRRAMSGKFRSRIEFQQVRQAFFTNCALRHYEPHVIQQVWEQIESFAGYAFAKGHSASYAVESYQSLFLKAHYPLGFMVGVINNFGGFYRTEFYVHEARRLGASIEAPCINRSNYLSTLSAQAIWLGFIHMKGLEEKVARQIVADRQLHGPYRSLDHFMMRHPQIGLEQIRMLIRMGAFRMFPESKQEQLWRAMLLCKVPTARSAPDALFATDIAANPLPRLLRDPLEDAFDELELLGFPLANPFVLAQPASPSATQALELPRRQGEQVLMQGYLVTTKETRTRRGESMYFGTFLDAAGDVFDTVHFPPVAQRCPFRGSGFYEVRGKVVNDHGVSLVEVQHMDKIPMRHRRPNG